MATKKKPSSIGKAIVEMAADQHRVGIIDDATYQKITLRHLGAETPSTAQPISGKEIRRVREEAHLSQAALARYLNLTVGYVSQLERGTKQAKGPVLALLNVIRHKGIEVVL